MTPGSQHPACLRVAHLVVSLAHGGLERLVVDWTNARNRLCPGSTTIVCLDELGDLASQVEGGHVVCLNADRSRRPWDREAVATLRAWVRGQRSEVRGQRSTISLHPPPSTFPINHEPLTLNQLRPPSILHAHNLAAWQYAVLAAWGTGARIVYTQHGANLHNQRLINRVRSRLLAFLTDEVVAVSAPTARAMSRSLWIPKSGIRVVANGVEGGGWRVEGAPLNGSEHGKPPASQGGRACCAPRTAVCRPSQETGMGRPPALVVGSVGRLAYVKGYDRLIRAISHFPCSMPPEPSTINRLPSTPDPRPSPVHLLLVGDGPERENLERLAADLGVADRVRFAGFQSDPRPFLADMDLFVLPSRSEGLPMGLLEAMAAGVPVAATDVGANREVIDDGACGLLLPDDEALWPAVLEAALADRVGLTARAERARERVATRYSMKSTLDEYERIYRRLTSGGRGGCGDDCACGKG